MFYLIDLEYHASRGATSNLVSFSFEASATTTTSTTGKTSNTTPKEINNWTILNNWINYLNERFNWPILAKIKNFFEFFFNKKSLN